MAPHLPVIDLEASAADVDALARRLGSSFERFGFAIVAGHGIDAGLIAGGWAQTRAFFALPEETKRGYHVAGGRGQRGYTPFRTEIAKGATAQDLKEFWHVGRERAAMAASPAMPPNVWPGAPEGFRDTFTALFDAFEQVGLRLLSLIARHLGLAPDMFEDAARGGNSILRLLHYPPVAAGAPGVRAEAHEDINLITLLLGADEAGLELLGRDGHWVPVRPPEGALAVNIGDMLQRLTNHRLPSTTHRVVNPPSGQRDRSRYSMPFFLHPHPDFVIATLPGCIDATHPNRYPRPITADAFLQQRLREIGLVDSPEAGLGRGA